MAKIIDCRLRPPYTGYIGTQMYEPAWLEDIQKKIHISTPGGPESARKSSMELLIHEMDEAGIEMGITQGRHRPGPPGSTKSTEVPNADLHRLTQEFPGRFVALGSMNVLDAEAAKRYVAEIVGFGLPGIALDLSALGMAPNDPRVYPIYELCVAAGLYVEISLSLVSAEEMQLVNPDGLNRAARDFPKLTFVAAHGCYPYVLEALAVAQKRTNVWLSPNIYMIYYPGREHFVEAANGYLRDRIVFGSCYPFTALKESVDRFMALPLEPEVRDLLLYKNAQRLLAR